MGQPAARLTDMTATADPITVSGVPNVLVSFPPAACIGDTVTGAVMVGAIAKASVTVIVGGRPAARMGDLVSGVNAVSGVPLTQTISYPCAPTVLIGG